MRIYNVRIGLKCLPSIKKSFTIKNEAVSFYNSYHPQSPKELNEADTIYCGIGWKKLLLEVI